MNADYWDGCIRKIVLDRTKRSILSYMYDKRPCNSQDIVSELKLDVSSQNDFDFLQMHGIVIQRNAKYSLTKEGKIIAYGLKEWEIGFKDGSVYSILGKLGINNHAAILDIGCGAGQFLMASSKYNPKFAIGIDIDVLLICLAKYMLKLKTHNTSSYVLIVGNAEGLPLREGTFDFIICRLVLPYVRNKLVISEISRVLSNGGKVYFRLHAIGYYFASLKRAFRERNVLHFAYCLFVLLNGVIFHLTGRQLAIKLKNKIICETFHTLRRMRKLLTNNGLTILNYEIKQKRSFQLPYTIEIVAIKMEGDN